MKKHNRSEGKTEKGTGIMNKEVWDPVSEKGSVDVTCCRCVTLA